MKSKIVMLGLVLTVGIANAAEYLVKFANVSRAAENRFVAQHGGSLELVSEVGQVYKWTTDSRQSLTSLRNQEFAGDKDVLHIEKNKTVRMLLNPIPENVKEAYLAQMGSADLNRPNPYPDNPEFMAPAAQTSGADPMLQKSWGLFSIDAPGAWTTVPQQGKDIVVAVTDTGVDYTHQDLVANIWQNTKEIAGDGIDNDKNGYVDDMVGWDFAANDNKPYDLSLSLTDILFQGGNPGHGTHVSGVIGSSLNNSLGSTGVAPKVKIMAVRFLTEKGQGGTAEAIKSIDYATMNGANIINASWGGESDPADLEADKLLLESIERAEKKGVLFMAAAGNGRVTGTAAVGFDLDTDPKPVFPAAYQVANLVTVAAIDAQNKLAGFSNFGKKKVKLGSPGVKILSTVPGNRYQDTIITLGSTSVTWDGTSMATPFVSGAAAVIWSTNPAMGAETVKNKMLSLVAATDSIKDKVETGGRLDLHKVN